MTDRILGISDLKAISRYLESGGYLPILSDTQTLNWDDATESDSYRPVTLIIHESEHERVWTNDEVLALLSRCTEHVEEAMEGRLIIRFDHLI